MKSSRSQNAKSTGAPSLGISPRQFHNDSQHALDFEGPIEPGSLNDDLLVRAAISSSIRRSDRSRDQIADDMSLFLGLRVTAKMLNTYSAAAMQANRFPAAWDRAFCRATGCDELLKVRAEAAGYKLIREEEIELLELGRQYLRGKRAGQEAELLEKRLAGVRI